MRFFCCGLFLLLAAGVLFSCGAKNSEKKFFDVPGYFRGEISYIKSNYASVVKTTNYNGNTKEKTFSVSEINWEKEFGIFLESDINKPVYYANMGEISTPSHASEPMFGWFDRSEKLPVRSVMLGGFHYGNASYSSTNLIRIQIIKSNLISETTIEAFYVKDSIYEIKGEQKIKTLGDSNTFSVKGIFQ